MLLIDITSIETLQGGQTEADLCPRIMQTFQSLEHTFVHPIRPLVRRAVNPLNTFQIFLWK